MKRYQGKRNECKYFKCDLAAERGSGGRKTSPITVRDGSSQENTRFLSIRTPVTAYPRYYCSPKTGIEEQGEKRGEERRGVIGAVRKDVRGYSQ